MHNYQYRVDVLDSRIESSSPYTVKQHVISVIIGEKSDNNARRICEKLSMEFISSETTESGYRFTAKCTDKTSAFFWKGGDQNAA